ncbi:hypothetical protein GOP47_0014072 [Adiantum capillus-veneris]|uniref:DUF7755 domain-containing protein n=1 Tax=Adiantum capillus-veneris TaxID=13818 RepID=A0A9D4UQF5_ADICA|nr:hypothetical protein GOP47_0014072 [Adiantum capillus-veneris]
MAFVINIQHLPASTYHTHVFRSFFPTFYKVHRSILDGSRYGVVCNLTATIHSQGAEAGKSNFKKPKWVLSVQEKDNKTSEDEVPKKSLFQVILTTSKDYGSSISDLNAGVLLAFIGKDGRCFMYRLSNLVSRNMFETKQSMELCESRHTPYRFQRGAQDVVTFLGPDVGKLEAVWVAPEQGTWRIQDMTVRVFLEPLDKDIRADREKSGGTIFQYNFTCEEALIGEETTSAAELRVSSISEISNEEFLHVDSSICVSGAQTSLGQVREEGLKEYEALKVSLLSYDALLVVAGSAIAAVAGHKDISEGYLIGGVLGFLYLFALERAVDQLPAAPSYPPSSKNENFSITSERKTTLGNNSDSLYTTERSNLQVLAESFNSFRAPLTRLSGILAFSAVVAKAVNTVNTQALSKEMLLAGAAGFLMTKFATILASNMPLSLKQANSSQGEA